MDNDTKVMLSLSELAMAADKNIILTKRAVIEKAAVLFNLQIPIISNIFSKTVKDDNFIIASTPKISKGENYNHYPYVLMDYPAVFGKENIFALRTMFWWGNFISITLHLKGLYKERYANHILESIKTDQDFYISFGKNEWQHHFENNNFIKSKELSETVRAEIEGSSFLKIALKYELHHWNMMQFSLPEGYKKILNALKT